MSKGDDIRKRILIFIRGYVEFHGYAPTYKEIGEHIGIKSKSAVRHHIIKLLDEGRLATDEDHIKTRAYKVARMHVLKANRKK